MRAHRLASAVGAASLGYALAACSPATPANIDIGDATATLHATAEGWVVDGAFGLVVETSEDPTETWLMAVKLIAGPNFWSVPLAGTTAEPITAFPLRVDASNRAVGAARFHALYPEFAWSPGDCASQPRLMVGGNVYDTSALDTPWYSSGPNQTEWIDFVEADLTCEPAP